MPQLPSNLVEPTEEAAQSSGGFTALDGGVYTVRLSECKADKSAGGKPMWRFEWDTIQNLDGTKASGGRLFSNITLEESVAWKIAQFFEAFGAPTTTNTDELVNSRIRVQLIKRVQDYAASKNYGKEINEIDRYMPLVEGDSGFEKVAQRQAKAAGPKKAAPAKLAPAKAQIPAEAPEGAMGDDSGEVDF